MAGSLVDKAQGFRGGVGRGGTAPQGREQLLSGHGIEEGEGGLEGIDGGLVLPQILPQQPLEFSLAQLGYGVGFLAGPRLGSPVSTRSTSPSRAIWLRAW